MSERKKDLIQDAISSVQPAEQQEPKHRSPRKRGVVITAGVTAVATLVAGGALMIDNLRGHHASAKNPGSPATTSAEAGNRAKINADQHTIASGYEGTVVRVIDHGILPIDPKNLDPRTQIQGDINTTHTVEVITRLSQTPAAEAAKRPYPTNEYLSWSAQPTIGARYDANDGTRVRHHQFAAVDGREPAVYVDPDGSEDVDTILYLHQGKPGETAEMNYSVTVMNYSGLSSGGDLITQTNTVNFAGLDFNAQTGNWESDASRQERLDPPIVQIVNTPSS